MANDTPDRPPNASNNPAPTRPTTPPSAADLQAVAGLYARFPWMFPALDPRARVTVAEVIARYLQDAREEVSERVYEDQTRELTRLSAALGERAIGELSPLHLREYMNANAERLRSGWTRARVNAVIQRCFNWAATNRLTRENPFRGYSAKGEKKTGRDMRPEEFQAILRHTDVYFRRFMVALKLTGARPGELSALKWEHIDWRRSIATLEQHKTRKKTGKPRVIVFVPQVVKLLAIIKRDQHGPAAVELRRILQHAPDRTVRAKEVVRRMKQLGYSFRAIYAAREKIGATFERVGGWREHGYTVYRLPVEAVEKLAPGRDHVFAEPAGDLVFVCSKQRPWRRTALGTKFKRLRKLIGLPMDCRMYGCRHFFVTAAVKRGVNLKAIATLVGHATTQMVERVYAHIDGDFVFLQQAAQAATALTGAPQTMPLPIDDKAWQELLLDKYPRAAPKPQKERRKGRRHLVEADHVAYRAWQFAVTECPELRAAADAKVYEWLIGRREFAGQLPPSASAFARYLRNARPVYEGANKRAARRLNGQGVPPGETPEHGGPA